MKKRVFAVCAAVLLMGSTMSMAPVIEDENDNFLKCIRRAQALITDAANAAGESPNDDPVYMQTYLIMVDACAEQNGINP